MTRTGTVITILLAVVCAGCAKDKPGRPAGNQTGKPKKVVRAGEPQGKQKEVPNRDNAPTGAPAVPVVCNRFGLSTQVVDTSIVLSIDTDLPDDTEVSVRVHRIYTEKGNVNDYSLDYFDQKSTVGEWRKEHTIPIDDQKWKAALKAKQKEMSRLGLGFDVASISDTVTVRAVVPIGQSNPGFGERNSKLSGSRVRTTGVRVVEDIALRAQYPDLTVLVAHSLS